jgi:hypothetical protein
MAAQSPAHDNIDQPAATAEPLTSIKNGRRRTKRRQWATVSASQPAELIRRQPAQMEAALVLAGAPSSDNIFYRLCPPFLLLPLVVLATIATIIASQSIITGARRGEVNIPAAFFSVPSSRKSGSQQTHRWRKGDSKPRSPTGSAAVAEPYTPKTARRTLRRS